MVPLDLSSWLGEYWWVWLSFVTVALYIFGVQLSHGVLLFARLFAILRGCPSTLHTTAVTKSRALVRDPKLFSGTSNQFKEWVFFSVELALRANAVRPGAHKVDYAMPFWTVTLACGCFPVLNEAITFRLGFVEVSFGGNFWYCGSQRRVSSCSIFTLSN